LKRFAAKLTAVRTRFIELSGEWNVYSKLGLEIYCSCMYRIPFFFVFRRAKLMEKPILIKFFLLYQQTSVLVLRS